MIPFARTIALLGATLMLAAAPAHAQSSLARDVAFFERAQVGPVELTPIGVVRDQRCADPRFCFRPNDMRISVILHDRRYPYEVVLRLGQPVAVPGGALLLLDPGTRPRQRGAIRLDQYALDIQFIPAPRQGLGR